MAWYPWLANKDEAVSIKISFVFVFIGNYPFVLEAIVLTYFLVIVKKIINAKTSATAITKAVGRAVVPPPIPTIGATKPPEIVEKIRVMQKHYQQLPFESA